MSVECSWSDVKHIKDGQRSNIGGNPLKSKLFWLQVLDILMLPFAGNMVIMMIVCILEMMN